MDKKLRRSYILIGLALITFGVVLYSALQSPEFLLGGLSWIWGVVSPVAYGLCVAFVVNVFLNFVEYVLRKITRDKFKGMALRATSMLVTVLFILGAIVLVIVLIVPAIKDTVEQLISYLPESMGDISHWVEEKLGFFGLNIQTVEYISSQISTLTNQLIEYLKTSYMSLANTALNVTTSVLDMVMSFVICVIFAIYVLTGKEKIGRFVSDGMDRFLPERRCARVREIAHMTFDSFACFVKGQLLEACILGVLCFIGMLIFRFPNSGVVSLMIGVTALIPIFGAWIGAGVGAFLILIIDPAKAMFFLIFILVLQQLEGNLIYPRVVGSSLGLPGIIVLAAVTIGGNISGVAGMLLGVPISAVIYTLCKQAVYGRKDQSVVTKPTKTTKNVRR